jgi:hypothetical protein
VLDARRRRAVSGDVRLVDPTNGWPPIWPSGTRSDRQPGACSYHVTLMHEMPDPVDLSALATSYGVSEAILEDLYARRRAGARDAELIHLLAQPDRGGLDSGRAQALVSELPKR